MISASTLLVVALGLGASLTACSKKDGGSAESAAAWPKAPADGTPIVAEFVKLQGEGDKREAQLRLFNFADKEVKAVHMKLHYLDASGKELKTFPFTNMKDVGLVKAKDTAEIRAGVFLPPETAKVTADFNAVDYADGSKWSHP